MRRTLSKVGLAALPAATLLLACSSAGAQLCPNLVDPALCSDPVGTCGGPDLIVGDITGVNNYTAVSGIDVFSFGYRPCNIGNLSAIWDALTNQHPVVAENLYKLRIAGSGYRTYEQIGQSWLHNEFNALNTSLCCTGCGGGDATHLGRHCTSTTAAAQAGVQSTHGPKWQVNPFTAVYPFPPANPAFSGTVARRLQVHIAELEPSSAAAQYFTSVQYLSPDDSLAGNQDNNESYRAVTISGSGSDWTALLADVTRRGRQGIRAWREHDAAVIEADVRVPGEGLFIVAAAVTALPGNLWHYEYAVQNMNSDFAGRVFSIPLAAGVTVSNIGFHDVDYHSGDGPGNIDFDGTDWTASLSNGSVSAGAPLTWSTQTFAQNPSANALRWGTLYNFRFDANVGPVMGEVSIGLFKPGGPGTATTGPGMMLVPGTPVGGCRADFDGNGMVSVPDIFAFLSAWFAMGPGADFDGVNGIGVPDIFAFLSAWFAGC